MLNSATTIPMKRSPMRRTGFKKKTKLGQALIKGLKEVVKKEKGMKRSGFKKKKKTPEKKAAERVWDLCRQIVILRDGGKCVHCHKTSEEVILHVHHYIVHDVASQESRFLFDNLVTLCSKDHLWGWHQQNKMDILESIMDHMGQFVDRERYLEILNMAGKGRVKRCLQDYLDLEIEFKEILAEGE